MARYHDVTIDQGSDIAIQIDLVEEDGSAKDLSGYSAAAKMKRTYDSVDSADVVDFTAIISQPATSGTVLVSLTNAQTDALNTRGRYVYDVEISFVDSDGNSIIERVLEGKVKVTPSVTR